MPGDTLLTFEFTPPRRIFRFLRGRARLRALYKAAEKSSVTERDMIATLDSHMLYDIGATDVIAELLRHHPCQVACCRWHVRRPLI